jgi:hypothetical protein
MPCVRNLACPGCRCRHRRWSSLGTRVRPVRHCGQRGGHSGHSLPHPGLTESIGGAMVLYHCVDSGVGTLNDRVLRWTPFAEPSTTIGKPAHTHSSERRLFSTPGTLLDAERGGGLSASTTSSTTCSPTGFSIASRWSIRFLAAMRLALHDERAQRRSAQPVRIRAQEDGVPTGSIGKHAATRSDYSVEWYQRVKRLILDRCGISHSSTWH